MLHIFHGGKFFVVFWACCGYTLLLPLIIYICLGVGIELREMGFEWKFQVGERNVMEEDDFVVGELI
jgi:hypothetical protein